MCRCLIRHRQPCVQDVPVSPAPEVGGVSLLAKALSAVTFIVFLCLSCDDVHRACASGGHTTEIIRLMESLSAVYTPRHYVIADTDRISEDKVRTFEASRQSAKSQVHRIISCSDIFVQQQQNGPVISGYKHEILTVHILYHCGIMAQCGRLSRVCIPLMFNKCFDFNE